METGKETEIIAETNMETGTDMETETWRQWSVTDR